MFREAAIKLGGATLLLLSIGFFAFGLVMASKFMQATGFMGGIVAIILLYYTWITEKSRPPEEEPPEIRTAPK